MTLLERGFEACAAGLREFGYSSVTAQQIETAHGRWKRGESAEDIIEQFAFRDFNDRPAIFGERDA